jgi:hypothetical protein
MSAPATDNSHRFLESLDVIDRFRVTQVASFAECPARWRANMLGLGEQKESPYAQMGTAVHLAIERYLRGDVDFPEGWQDVAQMLEAAGVSPKERLQTRDYCLSLADRRGAVLALETEVSLRPGDAVPILGHIDALFLEEVLDGHAVVIRDHKTNRSLKPVEWWAQQVQPRLYAAMVRQMMGERDMDPPIYFELGYVNLGVTHRWLTDPAGDGEVMALYYAMLDEFAVYRRTGEWPERVNEHCAYCPLKKTCEALPKSQEQFLGKLARRAEAGQSVAARYEFARHTLAAMQSVTDELRGELLALVTEHGSLQEGDTLYTTRKSTRREVAPSALLEEVYTLGSFTPEEIDSLLTVKVGELDRLIKRYPEIDALLMPLVRTVESEEVTLSAKKARK